MSDCSNWNVTQQCIRNNVGFARQILKCRLKLLNGEIPSGWTSGNVFIMKKLSYCNVICVDSNRIAKIYVSEMLKGPGYR